MRLDPPGAADEGIDAALAAAFSRAGISWTRTRSDLPLLPHLCSSGTASRASGRRRSSTPPPREDRWLALEYPALILDLAQRLGLDAEARRTLEKALVSIALDSAPVPAKIRVFTDRTLMNRSLERTEACPVALAYLEPLLEPIAFLRWLEEMAGNSFFFSGAESTAPIPMAVMRREAQRDRELLERWVGTAPVQIALPPNASERQRVAAERRYQQQVEEYERLRRRAAAVLATDPNALPLVPPPGVSAHEAKSLESINRSGRTALMPLVVLRNGTAPANLYISEVAPALTDYVALLRIVLSGTDRGLGIAFNLLGVGYGVLSLVSVPINCLYDAYHGSCTIEQLVPRLLTSSDAIDGFVRRRLPVLVRERLRTRLLDIDDKRIELVLDAFARWAKALADAFRRALFRLLETAADQGGARVRTPTSLAVSGQWQFTINETQADGTSNPVERLADEELSYESSSSPAGPISARDRSNEIFWILPNVWQPVGTAVALANQSGVRVWLNAANNRWGGHHPPHRTHRQGVSLDVDAGLAWRHDKVRNVVKRNHAGLPLGEDESPGNRQNADCLHFTERLAGWIVTQAFVLVGVTQYLYGDAALVEQAIAHLAGHFGVARPARMDGVIDAAGHNDHWHFELLVGRRPAGLDPYAWQVADADLLDKLHQLAVARDADPVFWERFAGLDKVPTAEADFDGLADANDWKRWWNRRNEPPGIALLPVWAGSEAKRTYKANQCWEPKGDFPNVFEPGETAV